jgi:tetratricopeptide (TPR) repeat protein
LAPSDPFLDLQQGLLDAYLGDFESAVATAQQGIVLDPINPGLYLKLAEIYFLSRRYDDALAAVRHAQQFGDIGITRGMGLTGFIKLMTSDAQAAIRACAAGRDVLEIECNALAYHALGRTAQAASFLARLQAIAGDHATYNYAEIYAQWGQTADAVHWLKRAQALHDGGLIILKVDPFLDPLHRTPEFAEIERQLAFRLEGAPARSP